jgi:anti-anti-sigma factor
MCVLASEKLLDRNRTEKAEKSAHTRRSEHAFEGAASMSSSTWNPPATTPKAIASRISDGPWSKVLELDEQVRRVARYVRAAERLDPREPGRCFQTEPKVVDDPIETTEGTLFLVESADACLISLCGEYDIANCDELSDAIGTGASRRITIDLANATFIDASVISVLVRHANRRRARNDSRLRIVGPSAHFRKIFRMCNLAALLDIEDSAVPFVYA